MFFIKKRQMESLPKDVAIEMALNLSAPDLISLCSTSKTQNRICNSNDFWRRKLEKDYPEELLQFYQTGEPVDNPKQVYVNKFTFLSRKIEEFVEELIEKIFNKNFAKFLTGEYKKEIYSRLYKIYEDAKINKYGNADIDEITLHYLEDHVPIGSLFNDNEALDLESIVKPFIEYLIATESINQTKKKLIREYKKQK